MSNKNVSLKLRQAKSEVKKIMEKYDLGGLVSLHDKTHTEFEFFMPRWSVIQIEANRKTETTRIRIRHKAKDNEELVTASYHVLFDCYNVCNQIMKFVDHVKEQLKGKIEIDNTPFKDRD